MTEFNEIEQQAKQRKEAVRATMRVIEEQRIMHRRGIGFLKPKSQEEFYDELRNGVIEEVARHIEKLTGFINSCQEADLYVCSTYKELSLSTLVLGFIVRDGLPSKYAIA